MGNAAAIASTLASVITAGSMKQNYEELTERVEDLAQPQPGQRGPMGPQGEPGPPGNGLSYVTLATATYPLPLEPLQTFSHPQTGQLRIVETAWTFTEMDVTKLVEISSPFTGAIGPRGLRGVPGEQGVDGFNGITPAIIHVTGEGQYSPLPLPARTSAILFAPGVIAILPPQAQALTTQDEIHNAVDTFGKFTSIPAGHMGIPGEKGARGVQGLRGLTGSVGEDGKDGIGLSLVDIDTVTDGYTQLTPVVFVDKVKRELHFLPFSEKTVLSQAVFLQHLASNAVRIPIPQGEKGLDGKDGENGKDGKNGINGRNGLDGQPGEQGLQGPRGVPGVLSEDQIDLVIPPGTPQPWLTSVAPNGFTLLDGRDLKRKDAPKLFATWGTLYGPGDGVTTFTTPDLTELALVEGGNVWTLGEFTMHTDGHKHSFSGSTSTVGDIHSSKRTGHSSSVSDYTYVDITSNHSHSCSGNTSTAGAHYMGAVGMTFIARVC